MSQNDQYFILSLVGTDRAGIVDEVSKFLFEHQCSMEDSRMSVLGGEFAMVLLASGDSEKVQSLESDLDRLSRDSGFLVLFKLTEPSHRRRIPDSLPFNIRVMSIDHPGIVFKISHVLHSLGANIERADTETLSAPFGGSPLFRLDIIANVPATVTTSRLRNVLDELADKENMDIEIQAAEI